MVSSDREDSSDAGAGAGAKKISGPLNAHPIPAGAKFGSKDGTASGSELSPAGGDRERKAKSGRFWPTFGKSTYLEPYIVCRLILTSLFTTSS
jgi:RalA-binding protein 1